MCLFAHTKRKCNWKFVSTYIYCIIKNQPFRRHPLRKQLYSCTFNRTIYVRGPLATLSIIH
jgi:hypothetical protein